MFKTTVQIDGMSCSMCESHINDLIRQTFRINKVKSDHKKNKTEIISEFPIGEEELCDAVNPAGYTVTGVQSEEYSKKGLFSRKIKVIDKGDKNVY